MNWKTFENGWRHDVLSLRRTDPAPLESESKVLHRVLPLSVARLVQVRAMGGVLKTPHIFDRLIVRAEAWLVHLDRERDLAMQRVVQDGPQPHLEQWLDALDVERVQHLDLVRKLEALQRGHYPALLLKHRPSGMLKATLPAAARKRA